MIGIQWAMIWIGSVVCVKVSADSGLAPVVVVGGFDHGRGGVGKDVFAESP